MTQSISAPLVVARQEATTRRSLWRVVLDALRTSREAEANREIARLIEAQGGRFNDELERRAAARMLHR